MRKWICASIRRTIKDKSRRREGGNGGRGGCLICRTHNRIFFFSRAFAAISVGINSPRLPPSLSLCRCHTHHRLPVNVSCRSGCPPTSPPLAPPTPTTTLSVYAQFCIYFQQINAAHLGHEKSVLINHLMLLPLLMPLMPVMPLGAV